MRKLYKRFLCSILLITLFSASAQMPRPALVGYWENWGSMRLNDIHENYNVIQLAFAVTRGSSLYSLEFNLPRGYSKSQFLSDIDDLHADSKVVILSIGGANDPVRLDNETAKNGFINSLNSILAEYDYKIDGIDLDFEGYSTSYNFGSWTMSSPAGGQRRMVEAVKSVMATYQSNAGRKLLLTMAPETTYVFGGMSTWQAANRSGGAFLPILDGLRNELDLIHVQLYNAGGSNGGTFARDGRIYYDTGDPDYMTALTESLITGFDLVSRKGTFPGLPEEKVAIGLPASYNGCASGIGVGSGFVEYEDVVTAVQYIRGERSRPSGWSYRMLDSYPNIGGLMTWSINKDRSNCRGAWRYARNFRVAFPEVITSTLDIESTTSDLSVFPNPTSDYITLENHDEQVDILIYNVLGNQVLTSNEKTIDVSDLASGSYFIINGAHKILFQKN